ncbi:hypothetical protein ABKN59_002167 [Abortiporus biennis]
MQCFYLFNDETCVLSGFPSGFNSPVLASGCASVIQTSLAINSSCWLWEASYLLSVGCDTCHCDLLKRPLEII